MRLYIFSYSHIYANFLTRSIVTVLFLMAMYYARDFFLQTKDYSLLSNSFFTLRYDDVNIQLQTIGTTEYPGLTCPPLMITYTAPARVNTVKRILSTNKIFFNTLLSIGYTPLVSNLKLCIYLILLFFLFTVYKCFNIPCKTSL